MVFEIQIQSALPGNHTFYDAAEWADLTGNSPIVDFGKPMAKFRLTLLTKAGSGQQSFAMQLADDLAFTENVRTVSDQRVLSSTDAAACVYMYALRGGQRFGRLSASGSGLVYDARLEWSDAR